MLKKFKFTKVGKKQKAKKPSALGNFISSNQLFLGLVFLFLGICLAVGGSLVWYYKVYSNPERVFWAMVNNNLATPGVSKIVSEEEAGSKAVDTTQMALGLDPSVLIGRDLSQESSEGKTVIRLQDLGTRENDFRTFVYVERTGPDGQAVDYSNLYGKWVDSNLSEQGAPSGEPKLLNQSLVGAVLFGNLDPNSRMELVNLIRDSQLYEVDFGSAERTSLNGRTAFIYNVSVKPDKLGEVIKKYGQLTGNKQLAEIDLEAFSGPSFNVQLAVDVKSRQIRTASYPGANLSENYLAYGLQALHEIPDEPIDIKTFNELLAEIEQN